MKKYTLRDTILSALIGLVIGIPLIFVVEKERDCKASEPEVVYEVVKSISREDIIQVEDLNTITFPIKFYMESVPTARELLRYQTQQVLSGYPESNSLEDRSTESGFVYLDFIPLTEDQQKFTWDISSAHGISPFLVYAIMDKESDYISNKVGKDGHDKGVMQVRDCNYDWINEGVGRVLDFMSFEGSVTGGLFMLDSYTNRSIKVDRGPHYTLMCYNMGPGNAIKNWDKGRYSTDYSREVLSTYENIKEMYADYERRIDTRDLLSGSRRVDRFKDYQCQ